MDKLEKARADAVRRRLEELTTRWPQAEIARRLGTSRTNVSRYLRGTRMPLDVGSAIVTELGVNPAWLLTGEGAPMLSDVSGATERTAGDLLALVEAMSQVAKMRLGSLAGKHHLRVLRELNDALTRHEELRERLNRQTVPQFRELQDHYEHALLKGDLDSAESLRRALMQLARLCDSAELERAFTRAQAYHELYFGSAAKAVELQRRVFHSYLPGDTTIDAKALSEAYNFSLTLSNQNRVREARAVCRTMLGLAEDLELDDPAVPAMRCAIANYDARLGRIREALPAFTSGWAELTAQDRETQAGNLALLMFLTDTVDYFGADALAPGDAKAGNMLAIATFTEDVRALDHSCERYIGKGDKAPPNSLAARHATRVRDLLHGRRAGWRQEGDELMREALPARNAARAFRLATMAAQAGRLAGDRKFARRAARRAGEALEAMGTELTPPFPLLASHWRNLLEAGDTTARKATAELVRRHLRDGYGCLRSLLTAKS